GTPRVSVVAVIAVGIDVEIPYKISRQLRNSRALNRRNPRNRIPTNKSSSLIKNHPVVDASVVGRPCSNRPDKNSSRRRSPNRVMSRMSRTLNKLTHQKLRILDNTRPKKQHQSVVAPRHHPPMLQISSKPRLKHSSKAKALLQVPQIRRKSRISP